MRKKKYQIRNCSFDLTVLAFLLFVLAMVALMSSCASLNKTKGYEHYEVNKSWK